jgi:hypothetical protein
MKKHLLTLSLLAGAFLFVQCGNQKTSSDSTPAQEEAVMEETLVEKEEEADETEMEATTTSAPAASTSAAPAAASQSAASAEKTKAADTKIINDNAAVSADMSAGEEEAAPTATKSKILNRKSSE